MAYEYFNCTVTRIVGESDRVRRYFVRFPEDVPFSFKAGQFVMLDLPIDSRVTNRAYSIASAPEALPEFELLIVINPDGLGTPYIFEHVRVGSTVRCSKALGKFLLPPQIDADLCFVCTGTGIAPLRSMLHHIYNSGILHKNIYMIFGNRYIRDILYQEELDDLAVAHPEFRFFPVLSRENSGWTGRQGYVHAVYEEIFSDKHAAYFYISGWSNMIHEARERIEAMGYDRKRIRLELFD